MSAFKMASIVILWAFLALNLPGVCSTDAISQRNTLGENMLLYSDILPANTSNSLSRIRDMSLSFYEFAYDSVAGRRQIGVLPRDAAKNFPGSVEVVESYTFPPKKKGESPTVVPNFPVVDKNVIFMHGIAALQELIKTTDALSDSVQGVTGALEGDIQEMKKIAEALDKDHSSRVRAFERQAAADLKREAAMEQLRVGASSLDEKHAAAALEQESRLLSLNEKAAIARLEKERELARESAQVLLDAEKKLAEGSEARHAAAAAAQKEREMALEAELVLKRADADKAKIRAESEARIKEELAQEDIAIRRIQAKGQLDSDRAMQSIKLVFSEVQAVVQEVLSSPERLFYIVGVLLLLLATYFVLRELIVLLREYVQTQIGKPALVRETSYTWSPLRALLTPVRASLRVVGLGAGGVTSASIERDTEALKHTFEHVVLEPSLKERIIQLAVSTRNTARSGACYRHLLLHGPPGTGKTLIARTLAQSSGLDYAIMSGGDVGPLGEDAVSQLHKLFRWAQRSEKGLLVFIDESEAFLHSRDGMGGDGDDSVHRRHALNALLYQTGTQSTKLLLVLATNRPEDLDEAVVDRMDASLLIDLPCLEERVAQCHLYMAAHVTDYIKTHSSRSRPLSVEKACATDGALAKIARVCDGFSGREISKLFIAAQHAMLLSPDGTLTMTALEGVVEAKVEEHQAKNGWREGAPSKR